KEEFEKRVVAIKHEGSIIMELTPDSIDMTIDEEQTIKKVMGFGREKNIVQNNVDVLKAMFGKVTIEPAYTYSEAKLTNIALEITAGVEGRVKDDSFMLDEENHVLVITIGTSGQDIIITDFKADVLSILKDKNITEYTIELAEREPTPLDVDVVHAKVCKEAKNAYVDETANPVVYHKHEMGIDFDKQELKDFLAKEENKEAGKTIEFELKTTKPEVTIQDITKDIYKDKLGSYTSNYINSDWNRASNVVLAAKILNGTIVMPGDTFSFNETMGDCGLSSRGFLPAAVFKAGKVVQEVGGGVCQISSTLYCAVLYANLDIVFRTNHQLPVGYVPASLDATIYHPGLDFKFKNSRHYPIKIVATTTASRYLTISIYGTKEDKEYEVELESYITETIPFRTKEQADSNMEIGKTKTIQSGANGYKSVAYRILKDNCKVVSKTLLSQDSYDTTTKIVAVGTKVVEQEKEETPTTPNEPTIPQEPTTPNEPTTPTTPTEPTTPEGGETNTETTTPNGTTENP
ncbi:MAG: VanW family protein, partial [Clostridia bacterium]|nr:VanW family protein [Clostridia bacterium]